MNTQDDRIFERNRGIWHAHNHRRDFPASKYHADQVIDNLCSGRNVISTIDLERGYAYKIDVSDNLASLDETRFADNSAAQVLGRTVERLTTCKAIGGFTYLSQGPQTKESFLTLRNSCERLRQNFSACEKLALFRDIAEKHTFGRTGCSPR